MAISLQLDQSLKTFRQWSGTVQKTPGHKGDNQVNNEQGEKTAWSDNFQCSFPFIQIEMASFWDNNGYPGMCYEPHFICLCHKWIHWPQIRHKSCCSHSWSNGCWLIDAIVIKKKGEIFLQNVSCVWNKTLNRRVYWHNITAAIALACSILHHIDNISEQKDSMLLIQNGQWWAKHTRCSQAADNVKF